MPARPKNENGLTELQENFIDAYIDTGGRRSKAAELAGYRPEGARQRARECLENEIILDKIEQKTKKLLKASATPALGLLLEMINNESVNPSVRVNCAVALLDRAGYKHAEKIEVNHKLDPESRRQRLAEIEAERAALLNLPQNNKNTNNPPIDAEIIDIERNQ